jgi:hypothetical protein
MFKEFLTQRLKRGLVRHFNNLKIARKAKLVIQKTPKTSGAPIIFFKASTISRGTVVFICLPLGQCVCREFQLLILPVILA